MEALRKYLEALPRGVQSFPDAKAKVGAHRGFFDEGAVHAHLPPAVLTSIFETPASSWVPEVHVTMGHIAMREASFESDADYVDYARKHNYRLFSSSLYRHAFRLFQPARIARLTNSAWGLFHRGSSIHISGQTPNSLDFSLRHRRKIWPNFVRHSLLTSAAEAMRVAGTESAHTTVLSETDTQFSASVRW